MSELFVYRSRMPASAEAVYRWHALPGALAQLTPPWENSRIISQTGGVGQLGSRVTIRVGIGPMSQTWIAEHTACHPDRMFRDTMVSGPFRRWEHTHLFLPDGAKESWLEDHVEYQIPFGRFGKLVGDGYLRRRLHRVFVWRHQVTAQALQSTASERPA